MKEIKEVNIRFCPTSATKFCILTPVDSGVPNQTLWLVAKPFSIRTSKVTLIRSKDAGHRCALQPTGTTVQIFLTVLNSLGTALFCCKFNLVDTDQFSCEYLVWVLCYCSQTDVLFLHWVGALAHTRDTENAPPIAGVKPEMCCDLNIFR